MDALISAIMTRLLILSVKAAVTIGLIFALRAFFISRKKARFNHVLWLALLLQLAIPVELKVPWSPYGLISALNPPARSEAASATGSAAAEAEAAAPGMTAAAAGPSVSLILFAVWITGAAFAGIGTLRARSVVARTVSRAVPVHDPQALRILDKARSLLKVRGRVGLLQSPDAASPCVPRAFHNEIVLPEGFAEHFNAAELECVFLHELSHIRRRDVLVDALVTALGVVYWFHPAVAAAFRALRRDREYACDAAAMSAMGGNARVFGETLLHALERTASSPSPQCALGRLDSSNHLRRRITMIASFDKKPPRWYRAAAALLAAAIAVFGAMAASGQESKKPVFQAPARPAQITLEFGWTTHPLRGGKYLHEAVDIALPVGTPVKAVADGKVVTVSADDALGNYVVIRHAGGFSSLYAKLQKAEVSAGLDVTMGQTIGQSGNTGESTGPHLHFALKKDDAAVNPKEYIKF